MAMKVCVLICQIALGMSLRLNAQPAGLQIRTDERSDEPSELKLKDRQGFEIPEADTGPNAPKLDSHALCNRLMKKLDRGGNPDVAECNGQKSGDFVINNMCLSMKESHKRVLTKHEMTENLNIAIIRADDRDDHVAHRAWEAYAKYHGYTYVKKHANFNRTEPMINDGISNSMILKILDDPEYKHINHFMYTELDQWPTQPLAKLEPIFAEAGLLETQSKFHWPWESDPRKLFAAVAEYPCDDMRDGGVFDMGNFLFVRHEKVHELFTTWSQLGTNLVFSYQLGTNLVQQAHNPHHTSEFPYAQYKNMIHRFEKGNPLGSPFGTMVGHFTGGFLEDTFDPELAKSYFPTLARCVLRRLKTEDYRPCAVYPRWVGGSCVTCRGSLDADGKSFGFYTGGPEFYHYTGCCGEVDSALPLETFMTEVKAGVHKPGVKVDLSMMTALDADDSS